MWQAEAAPTAVEDARTHAIAALEAALLEGEPPSGLGLPTNTQARGLLASWRGGLRPERALAERASTPTSAKRGSRSRASVFQAAAR